MKFFKGKYFTMTQIDIFMRNKINPMVNRAMNDIENDETYQMFIKLAND